MIAEMAGFTHLLCQYGGFVTEVPFYELISKTSVLLR